MAYEFETPQGPIGQIKRFLKTRLSVLLMLVFGGSSIIAAFFFEMMGQSITAGVALSLGMYLIICTIVFVTIPLGILDLLFN